VRTEAKAIASKYGIKEETVNRLVSLYGSRYTEVLDFVKKNKRLRDKICTKNPDITAEIAHAVEEESALTLTDFMLRRSLIGFRECEGLDCCVKVAKEMRRLLRWSDRETASQVRAYKGEIALRHAYEKQMIKHRTKARRKRAVRRRS
jgi:glycerol-3-phosphate dehydrogenase